MTPPDELRPPWIIRTYAGFSGASETNRRFHDNLKSGQTGLSVAFDLPTQNGYDPDAPLSRGEVGGTGVSIAHRGDIETLFRGIDPGRINTSMTINATAPFLLALYLVYAEEAGVPWSKLRGTVQNDLLKEFVARGTSIFAPEVSLRFSTDLITFTASEVPQWNPINVCGYHYMESGAAPHEEVGYALGNALLVLDAVRPRLTPDQFETVVRRISFFINSGIELIPEVCKMRSYSGLWSSLCETEYGIRDVPFRSGCQVRSVSLTAEQPENNIVRIALEALPALLSANARVNALQLPGFREALNLPDRMEQTLSIRTQQILMHETKITEFGDIFDGNSVIGNLTDRISDDAKELALHLRTAGYEEAIRVIDHRLTESIMIRQTRIAGGEDPVVGLNMFKDPVGLSEQLELSEPSSKDESFEQDRIEELVRWRAGRDSQEVEKASESVRRAIRSGENIMPSTIEFARRGGTVGEWSSVIEEVTAGRYHTTLALGDYRPSPRSTAQPAARIRRRLVLGKSGLDGHTNGLKVLALSFRDAGLEVIYAGTKQTPESLIRTALEEDADAVAVSTLSGAHIAIGNGLLEQRRKQQADRVRIILGGLIPPEDAENLRKAGIDLVMAGESVGIQAAVTQVCSLLG